jgi:hypothetical protein
MIEQKLIVGRYIELNTPRPVPAGPPVNDFQRVNATVLHIEESHSSPAPVAANNFPPGYNPPLADRARAFAKHTGQQISSQFHRQRTSDTVAGASPKAHRNFVWLEWMPGLVSEVQPNGRDVLTGPMSGCWIVTYLRGGVRYVGHIGTEDEPTSANTIKARTAWNNFVTTLAVGARDGFNPFRDWTGPLPPALPGEALPKFFALVTGENRFYSVVAYPQLAKITRIRIAGIQQKPSSLPANGKI